MDFAKVKAQIEASRRVTATVEGVNYSLVLPTEHAHRLAIEANREGNRVHQARACRSILSTALVGWDRLPVRTLLPDAPADAELAFTEDARETLLDCRQDIADELSMQLIRALGKRRKKKDDAEKN